MTLKKSVHIACLLHFDKKISSLEQSIRELQEDANKETKSSMGDKYETGKEMIQRERDLQSRQLAELLIAKKTLLSINPERKCSKVELGALVQTNSAQYFISASLGLIEVKGEKIMVISAISPIAQAMLGKIASDKLTWMNQEVLIESIT